MSKTSVLILGTGFLGGSLLDVLSHNQNYEISATSRQDSHLEKLKELGFKPIKASLDDYDKLVEIVSQHEVTINTASSDHPKSIEATLEGIQKRVDAGQKTVYMHTSGTGVLGDSADGMKSTDIIFYDNKPDEIDRLLEDGAVHRAIDQNILSHAKKWHQSDKANKTQIRIMIPPLIFGKGSGPFKDISVQIPSLIRASKDVKYAGMHGEGKAVTAYVNVVDLAEGYSICLDNLLTKGEPKLQSPGDVYVFASSEDEFEWYQISEKIGQLLKSKGVISSAEPKTLPDDKLFEHGLVMDKKEWNGTKDYQSVGGNARTRAVKLRGLGWNPKRTSVQQVLDSLERDVDMILKEK